MKLIPSMLFVLGITTLYSCKDKEHSSNDFVKATVISINEKEGKFDLLVERDTTHYEIEDVSYSKLPTYNEEIMLMLTDNKIIKWYRLSNPTVPLIKDPVLSTSTKETAKPFIETPPPEKERKTKRKARSKPPCF